MRMSEDLIGALHKVSLTVVREQFDNPFDEHDGVSASLVTEAVLEYPDSCLSDHGHEREQNELNKLIDEHGLDEVHRWVEPMFIDYWNHH